MSIVGKYLIFIGFLLIIAGVVLILVPKGNIPSLGRLPGDLKFKWGNMSLYIPITTSIIISILLSLIGLLASIFLKK